MEEIRQMLVDAVADYCLSRDYEYKFDINLKNLSIELAFRIKSDADKIFMNLKMN